MEGDKGKSAGHLDLGTADGLRQAADSGGAPRRPIALSAESFDGFAKLLEEPRPSELEALLGGETRWAVGARALECPLHQTALEMLGMGDDAEHGKGGS